MVGDEECLKNKDEADEDVASDTDSMIVHPEPRKKKAKTLPKFQHVWLDVEGFKPWISVNYEDLYHVNCKICNESLECKFDTLVEHAKSYDHYHKAGLQDPPTEEHFSVPAKCDSKEEQKIAKAEEDLVKMAIDIKLPLKDLPSLIRSLKNINPNPSSIFYRVDMNASKARKIAEKLLGAAEKKKKT